MPANSKEKSWEFLLYVTRVTVRVTVIQYEIECFLTWFIGSIGQIFTFRCCDIVFRDPFMQSAGKKPAFIVTISVCTYGCDRVGGIFFYRCAFLQPIVFLFIRHIDPVTLIDNWKIVVIFINIIFPKGYGIYLLLIQRKK